MPIFDMVSYLLQAPPQSCPLKSRFVRPNRLYVHVITMRHNLPHKIYANLVRRAKAIRPRYLELLFQLFMSWPTPCPFLDKLQSSSLNRVTQLAHGIKL